MLSEGRSLAANSQKANVGAQLVVVGGVRQWKTVR